MTSNTMHLAIRKIPLMQTCLITTLRRWEKVVYFKASRQSIRVYHSSVPIWGEAPKIMTFLKQLINPFVLAENHYLSELFIQHLDWWYLASFCQLFCLQLNVSQLDMEMESAKWLWIIIITSPSELGNWENRGSSYQPLILVTKFRYFLTCYEVWPLQHYRWIWRTRRSIFKSNYIRDVCKAEKGNRGEA